MSAPRNSLLFVICGPSGVGKTTLIEELFKLEPELRFSVSMTTRAPRNGEQDGVDYYFVSPAAFEEAVAAGQLLEHAVVHDHWYGTPKSELDRARAEGRDLVLDIDVQGAKQVNASGVDATFIFISPPDPSVLASRLKARATETPAQFETRLAAAQRELLERPWFEHEVINDELDSAVYRLRQLIRSERAARKAAS